MGICLWLSLCTAIGVVQAIVASGADEAARRPALFLIGDSTVRNHTRGQAGWGQVVAELFEGDHTHTNEKGARLNAECMAEGLRSLRTCALTELLLPPRNLDFPKKGRELRFDFACDVAAPGWTPVAPKVAYQHDLGYGFEPGASLTVLTNRAFSPPDKESFTSNTPFLFSAGVPEGNYLVTVFFGAQECGSTNTVKAESRRLMLESVTTVAGQFTQTSFCVNVRTPLISSNRSVRLKEREKGVLHWDDKLTLEFNGSRPAVGGVVIRPATEVVTVYLLGDSTVTDQPSEPWNSWGQMLTRFLDAGVAVANHAESGESLKSSRNALRVEKVLSRLRPGDYVLAQFGHNDQKDRATNTLAQYTQNLRNLVAEVRQKGATPILVTSMERLKGAETPTLGPYPDAVRKVAAEEHAPLVDLNTMSCELYRALGPDRPKAFQDGTHHTAYGSYELARCVVEGLKTATPGLAQHIRPDVAPFSSSKPDPFSGFHVPASPQRSQRQPDGS